MLLHTFPVIKFFLLSGMHLISAEGTCRSVYRQTELILRAITSIGLMILYCALGARVIILRRHLRQKMPTVPSPHDLRRAEEAQMTLASLFMCLPHFLLALMAITGTVAEDKQLHGD